jgi:hypothetical protein
MIEDRLDLKNKEDKTKHRAEIKNIFYITRDERLPSRRSSPLKHLFQTLLLKNRKPRTFMIYSIRLIDILFTSINYSYSFRLNLDIILIFKRPVRNTTRQSNMKRKLVRQSLSICFIQMGPSS